MRFSSFTPSCAISLLRLMLLFRASAARCAAFRAYATARATPRCRYAMSDAVCAYAATRALLRCAFAFAFDAFIFSLFIDVLIFISFAMPSCFHLINIIYICLRFACLLFIFA